MDFPLAREFINKIDENGQKRGIVLPCDIFNHLRSQGMDPVKAVVNTILVVLMGGMATNPSVPFFAQNTSSLTRSFDPNEALKKSGMVILQQLLAIAENFLIPQLDSQVVNNIQVRKPPNGGINIMQLLNDNPNFIKGLFPTKD